MVLRRAFLALLGAALSISPAHAQDTGAERQAYEEWTRGWWEAYNARDVDGLVDMYAEDAIRMPPEEPPARGKAAIRGTFRAEFADLASYDYLSEGGLQDVHLADGWAVENGWWRITILPGTRDELVFFGRYVLVARSRENGTWEILWDIWNTDHPSPLAGPLIPYWMIGVVILVPLALVVGLSITLHRRRGRPDHRSRRPGRVVRL